MSVETHNPHRNLLLAAMDARQLARLRPCLEPVDLPLGTVLESPGEPIDYVYFPEAGIGSVVALGPDGRRVEAGLFGRDGMSGLGVVLGSDRTAQEVLIQRAGDGHRVEADALREAMAADGTIRDLFLRFALALFGQSANTILATARLGLEARLARWLLMCHDRVDGDVLELTHEFLSIMLGVRRAGVTVALHVLEGRNLIKATRGRIQILDRVALEAATGGVYGLAEAEHARLMTREAGPEVRRAALWAEPPQDRPS